MEATTAADTFTLLSCFHFTTPLLGTADVEIEVPFTENPELSKILPFRPEVG